MKPKQAFPPLERDVLRAGASATARWLRFRKLGITAWVLLTAVSVAIAAYATFTGGAPARNEGAQNTAIAALQKHEAAANRPQFPVTSVQGEAQQRAVLCTGYSDQASDAVVANVTALCGWDGNGLANPVPNSLFWNQSPQLAHGVAGGGYSALPFNVQFAGSSSSLTYWVPVQQTGQKTAQVVGVGAFLNYPPTFVVKGCSADATAGPDDARIQAVNGLVQGAHGYAMPGQKIPFDGNGLTGATAGTATLCQGTGPERIVLAPVSFSGPTPGTHWTEGLAFKTVEISTHEIRIKAIGIDVSWQPQS